MSKEKIKDLLKNIIKVNLAKTTRKGDLADFIVDIITSKETLELLKGFYEVDEEILTKGSIQPTEFKNSFTLSTGFKKNKYFEKESRINNVQNNNQM